MLLVTVLQILPCEQGTTVLQRQKTPVGSREREIPKGINLRDAEDTRRTDREGGNEK